MEWLETYPGQCTSVAANPLVRVQVRMLLLEPLYKVQQLSFYSCMIGTGQPCVQPAGLGAARGGQDEAMPPLLGYT